MSGARTTDLGARLRRSREAAELTQEELASKAGRVPCARGGCVRSNAEGVIPVGKAPKIVGGAFVAVLFVAAVWFIYAAESEPRQGDTIDAKVLYGSFVFTLFIASAVFLAVFVAYQWAKDGPMERKVGSVIRAYLLLCGLIFLSFLPFDTFEVGSIAPVAIVLGFGVGVGVILGGVLGVLRGSLRRTAD